MTLCAPHDRVSWLNYKSTLKKEPSLATNTMENDKMFAGFWLSRPLVNILQFTYPAYASFKALNTDTTDDDKQWLSYWIIVGLFNVLEFWLDLFVSWMPFYWEIKILFIVWAQLPMTRGAEFLYNTVVEPWLQKHEGSIDKALVNIGTQSKKVAQHFFLKMMGKGLELSGGKKAE